MTVGETIADRYLLEEEIGQGGMATVYRATDTRLHRSVAIKILHPFLASKSESAERFLRESQAIARLHHPNIIEIFDASQDATTQTQFIVMELIEGQTLQAFITAHPTRIPEMGLIMTACLCDALEHAHRSGVIHRDIKPENIMFTSEGSIKLMDFGIARILDSERLTLSGCLLGSPAHMAPEIINGEPYSFTCDIFALGTVLYYAMTNELPFNATTPAAVFNAILKMDFVMPSRHNLAISRECDRMIKKCLECKPSDRYESAVLLREAIVTELKKAGLEDYVTHLKQYYQDPEGYEQKILPQILERYNALAQTHYEQKHKPAAIEVLNRILVFDQNNEKARELLVKIRTERNLMRYITIGSGILLLLGLGLVCFFCFPRESVVESTDLSLSNTTHAAPDDHQLLASAELTAPKTEPSSTEPSSLPNEDKKQDASVSEAQVTSPKVEGMKEEELLAADQPQKSSETHPTGRMRLSATSAILKNKSGNAARGDKKQSEVKEKTGETTTTKDNASPQTELSQDEADTSKVPELPIAKFEITQPVFPYESYAWVKGKTETGRQFSGKFQPNAMGYIKLQLPAGTYTMSLSCEKVCIPITKQLIVTSADQGKILDNVVLDFADAKFTILSSEGENFYYLAIRDNNKSEAPLHIEPNEPIRIGHFARYQNKQGLTIFKIPRDAVLPNYRMATLMKYEKTQIILSAGETRSLRF